MGFLRRLIEQRDLKIDAKTWEALMARGGVTTHTGLPVNTDSAMRISAVFDCVKILSRDVGSLPCITYQRGGKGRRRAMKDYRYPLFHNSPNPEMTAMDFYSFAVACLTLRGNFYGQIQWAGSGRAIAIWPIHPDLMKVERPNLGDPLKYSYLLKGIWTSIPNEDMLHIRGLSLDGVMGLSVVSYARETFGLALAQEHFNGDFYKNGTHFAGILTTEKPLTGGKEAVAAIEQDIKNRYMGLGKSQQVLFLGGVGTGKFQEIGMPLQDAQFIESRAFQVREVARWFNMPLSKLGENDKAATYASVEQFQLSYYTDTLRVWLVTIEQALNKVFFAGSDLYCEFLVDALLRGDIKSRYDAYAVAIQNGFLLRNEVRERENLPTDNPELDKPLQPSNYVVAGQQIPQVQQWRMAPVIRHSMARIMARERADISREAEKRLAKGDFEGFAGWLDGFYRDHLTYCEDELRHIAEALAVPGLEHNAAQRHLDGLKAALVGLKDATAIKAILAARQPADDLGMSAVAIKEDEESAV